MDCIANVAVQPCVFLALHSDILTDVLATQDRGQRQDQKHA